MKFAKLDRRKFLKGGFASLASLCGANLFSPSCVFAKSQSGSGKVFIKVELIGGADGLFLYPYHASRYGLMQDLRAPLAVPSDEILKIDEEIGLNTLFRNIYENIHSEGHLKLISQIGTPKPDGSHENAQRVYSMGARYPQAGTSGGWLIRLMEYYDISRYRAYGINVGGSKANFFGDSLRPLAIRGLSSYKHNSRGKDLGGSLESLHSREVAESLLEMLKPSSQLEQQLKDSLFSMNASIDLLQDISQGSVVGNYPSSTFGRNCSDAAKILKNWKEQEAQEGNMFLMLHQGGFDTHANQLATLSGILSQVDLSIPALHQDLVELGLWEDTIIYFSTEFGRQHRSNDEEASLAGCDHGAANTHMLIGGAVNGGSNAVFGGYPSDQEFLASDRIEPKIDFRNPLWEILDWMGYDPSVVFTEEFSIVSPELFV